MKRIEHEDIIRTYHETKSVWKTGKLLGTNGQNVHRRLQRLGVQMVGNTVWEDDEIAELRAMVEGSVSITNMADRLNRTYAAVACKLIAMSLKPCQPHQFLPSLLVIHQSLYSCGQTDKSMASRTQRNHVLIVWVVDLADHVMYMDNLRIDPVAQLALAFNCTHRRHPLAAKILLVSQIRDCALPVAILLFPARRQKRRVASTA